MNRNKKETLKRYNKENKFAIKIKRKKWREKNPEKMALYARNYSAKKKDDPTFIENNKKRCLKWRIKTEKAKQFLEDPPLDKDVSISHLQQDNFEDFLKSVNE